MAAKELKEVVQFVVAVIKAGSETMEDGRVGFGDVGVLLSAFQLAPAAFAGVATVPSELVDLSEADKAVLFAEIAKLDLKSDTVELWAERVLKTAVTIGALVAEYVKAIKA